MMNQSQGDLLQKRKLQKLAQSVSHNQPNLFLKKKGGGVSAKIIKLGPYLDEFVVVIPCDLSRKVQASSQIEEFLS